MDKSPLERGLLADAPTLPVTDEASRNENTFKLESLKQSQSVPVAVYIFVTEWHQISFSFSFRF
jgi:hypothetical protein